MTPFMISCAVFVIICIIFMPLDLWLYDKAKYPERTKWYYKLPFGGIAAYIIEGKDL